MGAAPSGDVAPAFLQQPKMAPGPQERAEGLAPAVAGEHKNRHCPGSRGDASPGRPPAQLLPRSAQLRASRGQQRPVPGPQLSGRSSQVVPLRAVVAVPELQLSSSWVDFGVCYVNQRRVREVSLMNLSSCRSYWTVLTGQQEPATEAQAFEVSPGSGLLEARPATAPPPSVTLQVSFTARSGGQFESTLAVEGVLGEKACALRLRGQGSYDERHLAPPQL